MAEHDEEPAQGLRELALLLVSSEGVDSTLQRVAELAIRTIEACRAAVIAVWDGDTPVIRAAAGPGAAELGAAEVAAGTGPCGDARRHRAPVRLDRSGVETTWPEVAAVAASYGLGSILAVPLDGGDEVLGAMALSFSPDAQVDAMAESVASLFAAQCAAAVATARMQDQARELAEQMQQALSSRAVIDQAKGIIMARRGCDADEAFAFLVEISQRTNTKLRDVAGAIVRETGTGDSA